MKQAASAIASRTRARRRSRRSWTRIAGWQDVTAFVEVKRASLRKFGHEAVLRRVAEVLQPVLDRCVLISFDLAAVKILRLMTGARIGWVLERYDADSLREATALAPDFLFCNLERVPAETANAVARSVGLGNLRSARPRDRASLPASSAPAYVETMTVRSLRASLRRGRSKRMSARDGRRRPRLARR